MQRRAIPKTYWQNPLHLENILCLGTDNLPKYRTSSVAAEIHAVAVADDGKKPNLCAIFSTAIHDAAASGQIVIQSIGTCT